MTENESAQPEAQQITWEELLAQFEALCPSIPTVTDANFETRVLTPEDQGQVTMVDFFARHCGFCRPAAEMLEQVAQKGHDIVKFDCSETVGIETAKRFAIGGYPTFLLFRGGKLRSVYQWERTVENIEGWIASFSA